MLGAPQDPGGDPCGGTQPECLPPEPEARREGQGYGAAQLFRLQSGRWGLSWAFRELRARHGAWEWLRRGFKGYECHWSTIFPTGVRGAVSRPCHAP